jgi:hypothetical protein
MRMTMKLGLRGSAARKFAGMNKESDTTAIK